MSYTGAWITRLARVTCKEQRDNTSSEKARVHGNKVPGACSPDLMPKGRLVTVQEVFRSHVFLTFDS